METCDLCGHPMNPHVIAGSFTAPEYLNGVDVPVAGWMTCPEDGCECWSTWSIKHPDLPPELLALIALYLDHLREERAFELGG